MIDDAPACAHEAGPGSPDEREERRLDALHRLAILDTGPEPAFDDIVRVAAHVCDTPIAAVTLVDRDRQWFKARVGLHETQLPRAGSFCEAAVAGGAPLVVEDTAADPAWRSTPFVAGPPHLRFYASAPLRTDDGVAVGALCVADRRPRRLDPAQADVLAALARQVERLFSYRVALQQSEVTRSDLVKSRTRLQRILDSLTQGVAVHSPDTLIDQANPAAADILGLSHDQLLGRTPIDPRWRAIRRDGSLFPGDEMPSAITLAYGVGVKGVTIGIERPDGERRWLDVTSAPLPYPDTDAVGAVVTFTDITEWLSLNDQLRESLGNLVRASQERSSMLSAVSHDLRAPLAAIRMMTEILDDRGDAITEAQRRELIHRIRVEARRTEGVLADLVAADKISGGLGAPRRQRIDLEHLLRHEVRDFSNGSHDVRVGELAGDLMLWADRAQVERILDNLISNALRHTPQGSRVVVGAHERGASVEIHVDDDGPGVPEHMRGPIFDAYVRGDNTADRPGSGLGLFLVAQFAHFHGGRAWCEPSPLGGARFVVSLPNRPPPAT